MSRRRPRGGAGQSATVQNRSGKVFLVGAGPGDAELLTLKAARLLGEADVVVYDRLVSDQVLALIPPGTTRVFAGKSPGCHHMAQNEINDLLVRLAASVRRVVRLKGGDPLVFGRGGEEAQHLSRHGVAFEIVPGITAALACGAYAGVPLTHRGLSRAVHTTLDGLSRDACLEPPAVVVLGRVTSLASELGWFQGATSSRDARSRRDAHAISHA